MTCGRQIFLLPNRRFVPELYRAFRPLNAPGCHRLARTPRLQEIPSSPARGRCLRRTTAALCVPFAAPRRGELTITFAQPPLSAPYRGRAWARRSGSERRQTIAYNSSCNRAAQRRTAAVPVRGGRAWYLTLSYLPQILSNNIQADYQSPRGGRRLRASTADVGTVANEPPTWCSST